MVRLWLVGVLLLLLGPTRASARATYWAVVIGVSDYQHLPPRGSGMTDLRHAADDARAFAKVLQRPTFGNGGVAEANLMLLTDDRATAKNTRAALRGFLGAVDSDDVVVVYFAGHGVTHPDRPDETYLLLHDTPPDKDGVASFGLPLDDVESALRRLPSEHVLVFADACHADAFVGDALGGRRGLENAVGSFLLELESSGAAKLVFTSSGANEYSVEDDRWALPGLPGRGHGVFTHGLIKALRGELGEPTSDGFIRLGALVTSVTQFVDEQTEGTQRPRANGGYDPLFPIATVDRDARAREQEILDRRAAVRANASAAWRDLRPALGAMSADSCTTEVLDFMSEHEPRSEEIRGRKFVVSVDEYQIAERALEDVCAVNQVLTAGSIVVRVESFSGRPQRAHLIVGGERQSGASPFALDVPAGVTDLITLLPADSPLGTRVPHPIRVPVKPGATTDVDLRLGVRERKLTWIQRGALLSGLTMSLVGAGVAAGTDQAYRAELARGPGPREGVQEWRRRLSALKVGNVVGGGVGIVGGSLLVTVPLMPGAQRTSPRVRLHPQ